MGQRVVTKTKIEWTDDTVFVDRGGRRTRTYHRTGDLSRPGQHERRRRLALGEKWCRGCTCWLPAADVGGSGWCRPCANADYRARYAADGESIRQRVYARKRSLDTIPAWWVLEHREVFGGLCSYGCGRVATTNDHVWPVARGGTSAPGNVVPACSPCNTKKRDSHPESWVQLGRVAFPHQWMDIMALASIHGTDQWVEAA